MPRSTFFTPRCAVLVALLATLLFSVSAIAQVDTAAVRGTVTDPSGAVVPNAKVTLTNDATSLSVAATSAADGTYTFGPVKIGPYTVNVEAAGFRKATTHLTVHVQEQARADFQLMTGAASETIEVTSAAPQLQTQDASVGTVATSQQVNDLPLNGRNYTFLAQLGAGVTKLNPTRGLDATGSFVANGLTTVHNNYMLDGIDNNAQFIRYSYGNQKEAIKPSVDAISQFSVVTNGYSAEYGRSSSGVVSVSIKSGTNTIHGSGYGFFRNDAFDATPFFASKTPYNRTDFGASVGGPLV